MRDRYDVIVIGSGIGGLVSAALLSKAGKKVLVIEKEPKPGGYLQEFTRDGFIFDVSLHLLNGCSEGQYIHDIFKRCGIIDDIKFVRPAHLFRSIFPDFEVKIPQEDMEGYVEILCDMFPASQKGVENLIHEMSRLFNEVNKHNHSAPITSILATYLRNSAKSIINKYISDVKLQAVIGQFWMYFGLPPSMMRAVDFCYPCYDYTANGGYYLERGSSEIVRLLVERVESHGGKLIFNRTVDGILADVDGCTGVKCGVDIMPCDMVISNIDPRKTIFDLMGCEKFHPDSINRLKSIGSSISAVEIFLGLDIDLKNIYPDEYEIFMNAGYNIDEQYDQSCRNNANIAPFAIGIYSNVNRFAAPTGRSVVTLVMLSGYDYWKCASRAAYEDKKEKIGDILISRAAKIIPEIQHHIVTKSISTPLTFERYTNNHNGAIYGYVRSLNGNTEVKSNEMRDVKKLYTVGAWARQGSGVMKVLRSADDVYTRIMSQKKIGLYSAPANMG